jgi:hypothetical protein
LHSPPGAWVGDPIEVDPGKPGGGAISEYVIEDRGGLNQVSTGVPVLVDQTAFLVLKAEFRSAGDRFTLYVNPPPVPVEPSGGVVRINHEATLIQGLTIYSTGEFSLDELRIGTSYADVAPFPVPALHAAPLDGGLQFTWDAPGFQLEQASGFGPEFPWTPVPAGNQSPAWVESPPAGAAFYRLATMPSATPIAPPP